MKELSEALAKEFAAMSVEVDEGSLDAYTVGLVEARILEVLHSYNPRFNPSIFRVRRASLAARRRDVARREASLTALSDEFDG